MTESSDYSGIDLVTYWPTRQEEIVLINTQELGIGVRFDDYKSISGTVKITPTGLLIADFYTPISGYEGQNAHIQIQITICPITLRVNYFFLFSPNISHLGEYSNKIRDLLISNYIPAILKETKLVPLSLLLHSNSLVFLTRTHYRGNKSYLN